MYYGPTIVIKSGIEIPGFNDKERMGVLLNIPLAFTNALGSTIAVFIIDKLGRRYIMLRALPGIFVSLLAVSVSMWMNKSSNETILFFSHIIFAISIVAYLGFFSVGFSSTPWTVNSEIYPIHLAGTAAAIATATNWLSNFAVSSVFLSTLKLEGGDVFTFDILALFSVAAWLFIFKMLPETAGQTVSQNVEAITNKSFVNQDRENDFLLCE